MEKQSRKSQLVLFVVISYAYLWLLFGIGRVFDIPFSYDPREMGGILVLVGIPASLFAASLVTLITGGKEDLRRLFRRSLEWRFAMRWYLASLLTPLLVAFASAIAAVAVEDDNGEGYVLIEREALIQAIRDTQNLQGLAGLMTCSAIGDCGAGGIQIFQVQDGVFVQVSGFGLE